MTCLEIQLKNRLQLLEVEDSTNESEEVKRKSEMMEEHYTKAADWRNASYKKTKNKPWLSQEARWALIDQRKAIK